MKLLTVLPEVAAVSEIRFAANFQELLLNASMEINDALFIIHEISNVTITDEIKDVISIARCLGKECQVIRIDKSGFVESV